MKSLWRAGRDWSDVMQLIGACAAKIAGCFWMGWPKPKGCRVEWVNSHGIGCIHNRWRSMDCVAAHARADPLSSKMSAWMGCWALRVGVETTMLGYLILHSDTLQLAILILQPQSASCHCIANVRAKVWAHPINQHRIGERGLHHCKFLYFTQKVQFHSDHRIVVWHLVEWMYM